MEQGLTAIVISVFIIFLFVPAVFLTTTNSNKENLKKNLYFATTALADTIEIEQVNYDELSKGYRRYMENFDVNKSNIDIDEPKLLVEFNNLLFKNYQDPELYSKIQASILAKVLIYSNRFVIVGHQNSTNYDYKTEFQKYKDGIVDTFGPAYYFTKTVGTDVYYLNTKDDYVYDENFEMVSKKENFSNGVSLTVPNYEYFKKYEIDMDNDGVVELYYLNTRDNKVYNKYINVMNDDEVGYYDSDPAVDKIIIPYHIDYISLTKKEKNEIIIKKINQVISEYTDGLVINFPNSESLLQDIRTKELNFFQGVTFLVIYKENSYLTIKDKQMDFKEYIVSGYTLK
ncbi:MAG: hypothetical protein A2Y24_02900 [Clostridiales bacterium GWE2_32_10]|nr:MAG: hypothetical protein A2Y24_02900 [Clostridiales bacterium GWE2_32_10]HBY19555.1 hypothetical protein [Clostridiales bacterium]